MEEYKPGTEDEMNFMEEKETIVTLVDEDGNEVEFDLLMTFDYEGKRYVALIPITEIETVAEDEIVILEVVREGKEETYRAPDNEILLNEVFEEFLLRFDEMVEEED